MKRIKRSPERFEVLDLFARISRDRSLDVSEAFAPADFARLLGNAIQSIRRNASAIHGRRTQEMFAYVAVSLRQTALIKTEDAGDIVASQDDLTAPDYRVVLRDNTQLLIEVKNSHTPSPTESIRMSQ